MMSIQHICAPNVANFIGRLIARARLLEAEEFLRKQDEVPDRHLTEDYHRVALSETRGAIKLCIDAGRMLVKR